MDHLGPRSPIHLRGVCQPGVGSHGPFRGATVLQVVAALRSRHLHAPRRRVCVESRRGRIGHWPCPLSESRGGASCRGGLRRRRPSSTADATGNRFGTRLGDQPTSTINRYERGTPLVPHDGEQTSANGRRAQFRRCPAVAILGAQSTFVWDRLWHFVTAGRGGNLILTVIADPEAMPGPAALSGSDPREPLRAGEGGACARCLPAGSRSAVRRRRPPRDLRGLASPP